RPGGFGCASCGRPPRLPIKVPRPGDATSSPNGDTRFGRGIAGPQSENPRINTAALIPQMPPEDRSEGTSYERGDDCCSTRGGTARRRCRIDPKTSMPGNRLVLGPAIGRTRVPGMFYSLKCSGLRLRGDLAGWRLWAWARLAGRRHRRGAWRARLDHRLAHGPLACKQINNLVAGQRLELEQSFREHFQVGPFLGENLGCLRVSGFDEPADFSVDLARSLLGNILLARNLIAEENLVLVFAIGNRSELIGQAPARHHHARKLCRL